MRKSDIPYYLQDENLTFTLDDKKTSTFLAYYHGANIKIEEKCFTNLAGSHYSRKNTPLLNMCNNSIS